MKLIRAILLAIIVSLSLAGSTATLADAIPLGESAESTDPGDPGLPPDP